MKKERLLYLDVIKIIACFLVIVNHTVNYVLITNKPSVTWFLSVGYFFLSKPAVPLFVMVSGATLLSRQQTYRAMGRKVLRILVVLVVFSFLYYEMYDGVTLRGFFLYFLPRLLRDHSTNSYWYLYMYLGLLLLLPILSKLVRVMEPRDFIYLFCLTGFFRGLAPILAHYMSWFDVHPDLVKVLLPASVTIFLAGHFFAGRDVLRTKMSASLAALGVVALLLVQVVATYFEYRKDPADFLFWDNRDFITIMVLAVLCFCLIKYLVSRIHFSDGARRAISALGECTFGIYLMAEYVQYRLYPVRGFLVGAMNPLLGIVLLQLLIFGICFILTYLLRKIPKVSNFL